MGEGMNRRVGPSSLAVSVKLAKIHIAHIHRNTSTHMHTHIHTYIAIH